MDNRELNAEEMEKVTGGSQKTIQTKNAVVRLGPGKNYPEKMKLSQGTTVNFTGTVSYNDQDGESWYMISSPTEGWVTKSSLGV